MMCAVIPTSLHVQTESGAIYEFNEGLTRVRRVSETQEMRRDNDWIECYLMQDIFVGQPLVLVLRGVSANVDFTMRVSTPVVRLERGPLS